MAKASVATTSGDAINWIWYPKSRRITKSGLSIVEAFRSAFASITSSKHKLNSNSVLLAVRDGLVGASFRVEAGKKVQDRIEVPVLFGLNGVLEKRFWVDAYHEADGFVLEVEAGQAVDNNKFLKHFLDACLMHGVRYCAIALRNTYRGNRDFQVVCRFFDTLFASDRMKLPLEGILVIGY